MRTAAAKHSDLNDFGRKIPRTNIRIPKKSRRLCVKACGLFLRLRRSGQAAPPRTALLAAPRDGRYNKT